MIFEAMHPYTEGLWISIGLEVAANVRFINFFCSTAVQGSNLESNSMVQ